MPEERQNFNDFPPESEEQLSPPIVQDPIHDCAEAVHVYGFTPGAIVRVYVNQTDLVGERRCHFGSAKITLRRALNLGEDVTATQEVNSVTSGHSIRPVTVTEYDEDEIASEPPTVSKHIYECGHIVPVSDLTPSVRVEVGDSTGVIGSESTGDGGWEAVFTSRLHANQPVRAREVACDEEPDKRIEGPWSAPESVQPAPDPVPSPNIDDNSLVVGNDTVILDNCLPGARITIKDGSTTLASGWYATSGRTRFPVDPSLQQRATITATQELCGNTSTPATGTPTTDLRAPEVVEPICEGAQYVAIRDTVINATVVVFKNNTIVGYGGAGQGTVVLGLGGGQRLSQGDDITARQYMGPTLSPISNTVTVGPSLVGQPHVTIEGGEPFYDAETAAGEQQIDGPVFPRDRGAGPRFLINSCCREGVRAVIIGPEEEEVAELQLTEVFPGYHRATWDWTSPRFGPDPSDIPIGRYSLHVRTECEQDDVREPFYVIFDPDTPGAGINPPRFSFYDTATNGSGRRVSRYETAVWFGTGQNSIRALLYHLHPDDERVFSKALGAASGETSVLDAAEAIARAEAQLFTYSLSYHTNDVIEMLEQYSDAQCADDAGVLTAMLRAIGIAAHPVTADAAIETGDGSWNFDTWVEFLAPLGGQPEWRVLHTHWHNSRYEGPTTRRTFGTSHSVATRDFNDVIVMGDVNWKPSEAGDSASDVSYDRNECREPESNITKKPWVKELCERGYWRTDHWRCTETRRSGLRARDGFRFEEEWGRDWEFEDLFPIDPSRLGGRFPYATPRVPGFEYESTEEPRFGEQLSGTLPIHNYSDYVEEGRVTIELVSHRIESKQFAEETFDYNAQRMRIEPGTEQEFDFELEMPDGLAPGHQLYIRARLDERTLALHELEPSTAVESRLEVRRELSVGDEFTMSAIVHNVSDQPLTDITVDLDVPFFVEVENDTTRHLDEIPVGTEQRLTWTGHAQGAMEAGTIVVDVQPEAGGSSRSTSPLRITGPQRLLGEGSAAIREEDR